MGRPKDTQPQIKVKGAASREVYFQALTLFRKSDQLCFEHTRERADDPKRPSRAIMPSDVSRLVNAAIQRLRKTKQKLGIKTQAPQPARIASKQSADVFRSIVQANRQLNLLLDQKFTPSDVYKQVTCGVALASRLLESFPAATTIPDPPKFEVGKRPADVYRRVARCFERIRQIAKVSGENVLDFEPDEIQIRSAEPSDVYDIASMLVSELAHLHSQSKARPPRKVYYPGRKFPSHVYQRVGLLEFQLRELEARVQSNPTWLTRPSKSVPTSSE